MIHWWRRFRDGLSVKRSKVVIAFQISTPTHTLTADIVTVDYTYATGVREQYITSICTK